ncbi:apoptotic chromatin condensation inducer in the nucleus [Linepithema humile]|uniref:apoptotic chromatin condensation inducer in the nucleus n=1 Tax=Linepithema humile TaxID=83485 RepID=UPI0006236DE0|nr:PREDICTED: apoptotic chromatin condensation inducer in the nucleus [Linepithema humile]XP_012219528.1 PREDICTED: apoptotic chromatin condensation inducer in the nucleus [Linepithema humile]
MRRKSERNKAKGSPEKKVEKPTRKSTRRRGRRSPSTSSEQDTFVEDAKSAIQVKEIEQKETSMQTRLQSKELEQTSQGREEKIYPSEIDIKVDSPEDEEDNGGSVWKVARADASPGEIQKLKLCRQRNTSEASSDTAPSSRKTVKSSGKWQESGEGIAEEADSADEQLVSCTRTLSSAEQPNDPSSSYPGQDSNEEVSDSKEILPETTSANLLSDDKPNIDQHGESNEANCAAQIVDSEPGKPGSTTAASSPSPNGDDTCEKTATAVTEVKEEKSAEDIIEKPTETEFSKETSVENVANRDTSSEDEDDKVKTHRPADSSSESNDESRLKSSRASSDQASPRTIRRKPRSKYRDSSNSETPDSEDEPIERKVVSEPYAEEEEEEKQSTECSQENKEQSASPERTNSHSNNVEKVEIEQCETVPDKSEESTNEKSEQIAPVSTQTVVHKPVKVNLKRSFSARILSEKNEVKRDDADASVDNESSNQNKENGSEQEPKCVPRKRRWGTALSTDTTPSFSISTDSLKALVPGAKPLSINEVRLSKDDDEDRDRHRSNDKRHNSNDSTNDSKVTEENLQKNGAAKKGNAKVDNHLATRRKISIVKEVAHVKSPSPPASKPTNILLIKNLVRPFTLNQIKELLSRTGTIVENGFWMDRIKSKCIVEYSNEDQAFETRQALHGISWPMSNPKKLHVEYATSEDMETARESSKEQPIARKAELLSSSDAWQQDWVRDEKTNTTKVTVVREWDLGKEDGPQHIREKERDKKEQDKKRRARSRSPTLDAHLSAPARKFKKKEDDPPPAKLLDDLFRKTKATPCIYWLPLTNEQIVVKEEMRRQHMAEHARRLEEMRRADRNRDGRRRRSPRK